jgi:hypothetical protein
MSTYEITLTYPDRSLDQHRRFLQEVGGSRRSGLIAFHQYGQGVVLTIQVETDRGRGMAIDLARERAAAFWPSFQPSEVGIDPIAEAG